MSQSSSETRLIPCRKDNRCLTALFHNLVFPRMGDMLGISLFHLLNETYLLPQIMCLFSLSSRTNCFTGGKFSAVIRKKKLPIDIKGTVLFFHVPMCPDKIKWHRCAAVMKEMLTPTDLVQILESCLLCFHDNSKSYMHGNVYLLDDIMGGFSNSEKRLDKN